LSEKAGKINRIMSETDVSCCVFLTNIDTSVSVEEVKSLFGDSLLNLWSFESEGVERREAVVELESGDAVSSILCEINGIKMGGSHIGMRRAKLEDLEMCFPLKKSFNQPAPHKVLYVGNIPFEMSNSDVLMELFSKYGTVEKIRMSISEEGYFRGFANVTMKTIAQAIAAQRGLLEHELAGRKLLVLFDKYGDSKYY
jgi:RNA recognition motif-containing protein